MTSRSLSIINDTQRNLSGTQLRSNTVPTIELIGDKQSFISESNQPIIYNEIFIQNGTPDANYEWPYKLKFEGTTYYDWSLVQIKNSGYYTVSFQCVLNLITEVDLNLYVFNPIGLSLFGEIRKSLQRMPVNNTASASWTQYFNAGEAIRININPAANVSIIPDPFMQSPTLRIVQLTQFYTDSVGYKSTLAKNTTTQTFTTAVTAALVCDTIPGAANRFGDAISISEYNQGGGNQLGFVSSSYASFYVDSAALEGNYFLETQITITKTT
jgi:hypothetical protein